MWVTAGAHPIHVLAIGEGNGTGTEILWEQIREGDSQDGEYGDEGAEWQIEGSDKPTPFLIFFTIMLV